MTKQMSVKVNGAWKKVKQPWVHVNGSWKKVKKGWVHVNGAWKEFYTSEQYHTLTVGTWYTFRGYYSPRYGSIAPSAVFPGVGEIDRIVTSNSGSDSPTLVSMNLFMKTYTGGRLRCKMINPSNGAVLDATVNRDGSAYYFPKSFGDVIRVHGSIKLFFYPA